MTIKIAHVYGCTLKKNSGDYTIGIATKRYFAEHILKVRYKDCIFFNFNCRDGELYTKKNITKLNNFHYIIVGAGGLILPDSNPNNVSCWQWKIHKDNYKLIIKPIYVISIGYNLFSNQTMAMPNRRSNKTFKNRVSIFKANINELVRVSQHFSLRHKYDVKQLSKWIAPSLKRKIKFEPCPTIWYSHKYWLKRMPPLDLRKYIAIEIKDDRQWRRYHKIGVEQFYDQLLKFVIFCQKNNKQICILSHDGSDSFQKFLKSNDIQIPLLNNSIAKESKIYKNYAQIHTILCMAGHSQMMSHALGIKTISLVTHPKILAFCKDNNNNNYIQVNNSVNFYEKLLQLCEFNLESIN